VDLVGHLAHFLADEQFALEVRQTRRRERGIKVFVALDAAGNAADRERAGRLV